METQSGASPAGAALHDDRAADHVDDPAEERERPVEGLLHAALLQGAHVEGREAHA